MASRTSSKSLSSNGGADTERKKLYTRFSERVTANHNFSRRTVSYQGNKEVPGLRWLKYKEGFSTQLIDELIKEHSPDSVLDPFAGLGTTPLVAAANGCKATGIEIMPVGVLAGNAIAQVANGLNRTEYEEASRSLIESVCSQKKPVDGYCFPHVRITSGAFPDETEKDISIARHFLSKVQDRRLRTVLELACMSVLEDVSYTRKDGQYLRWDRRANRTIRSSMDKGLIPSFKKALQDRLKEISDDFDSLKELFGGALPELTTGSCLQLLRSLPSESYDMVITSPPYANRYDYTRTYALELAWLGFDQADFSHLRQSMLTATVENRKKTDWLSKIYGQNRSDLDHAFRMFSAQDSIHEIINVLTSCKDELSNRNVLRLVEGYFMEMAVVVAELGRIVRPGGTVIMINDNVQYHGEEVPVDCILSDFAEQSGFECKNIWKLARGKGNSSQQMARFGRREIRKCVYRWTKGER